MDTRRHWNSITYSRLGRSDLDRRSLLSGFSGDGARVDDPPPPNHRLKRLGEDLDLLRLDDVEFSRRSGPSTYTTSGVA